VEVEAVEDGSKAGEATVRVFEGDAADDTVDFIALLEEEFSEVRAVLAGDAGDEGSFHFRGFLSANFANFQSIGTTKSTKNTKNI
jgi:hypothetical protein